MAMGLGIIFSLLFLLYECRSQAFPAYKGYNMVLMVLGFQQGAERMATKKMGQRG